MVDKNSDYKKINFNLNNFLPETNKGEFLESLNKNLFNRYLTKDEFNHIVGLIGDVNPNDSITKPIKENSTFRQTNQLQPVVNQKIGSVNNFMSFEDFMTRIARTGVDTEKFDEWGNTLQFNWVPPIDLDKIVNYRDYYWNSTVNSSHTIPQYITIKSQKNWANARYSQALKTVIDVIGTTPVINYDNNQQKIFLSGNVSSQYTIGNHLVLSQSNGVMTLVSISTITYNISSAQTEITTVESFALSSEPLPTFISSTEIPVISISGEDVIVSGNLTNLLIDGYVLGVNTTPMSLYKVSNSDFDTLSNRTTINLDNLSGMGFNKISLYPVLSLMQAELEYTLDNDTSFPTGLWNNDNIGKLFWYQNIETLNGTQGQTFLGSDFLEDTTKNFLVFNITNSDILQIATGNKGTGKYNVSSVSPTRIITNSNQFFSTNFINYRILKKFNTEIITSLSAPISPTINQLWINPTVDTLNQWNGSTWNTVYKRISIMKSLVDDRVVTDYSNVNDWSYDNEWVHRSQINEFTGMIRAQMPIIEYFPYLDMSETSYSEKIWRYRQSDLNSYVDTSVQPKMIELMNFTYTGSEFYFADLNSITFNQKFGNFVEELKQGDQIRLSGFTQNDGIYTISSVNYDAPSPTARYVSTITLSTPIISTSDIPIGANFGPYKTSVGDEFTNLEDKQWEFGGIRDIRASSLSPIKNPMLDVMVSTSISGGFESIIGLTSQIYSSQGNIMVEPTVMFDNSLHDLVLYDDYQEGDIRVYINNKRIYGAFEDLMSNVNPNYVGGIKFINGYTIYPYDIIRVELGEYAKSDIGRRAIMVNTASGNELYNLTNIRKIEQKKSESNQYPYFALRDIYGNRLNLSTSIFKFAESESSSINANILKRIVMNADGTDYSFIQELKDNSNDSLYCYYDYARIDDELQTIWKRGSNSEQYVPIKIDNEWEMPNQWYYNINHENYSEIKLTEIFRHFKSIIAAQTQPGLFSKTSGLFFLDDNINYGIGGTIKEHNDGFDTLVSSIFVNNGTAPTVIEFAKNQYNNQIRYVKEKYYQDAGMLFSNDNVIPNITALQEHVNNSLTNYIENNGKYDQWFGDTTSYDYVANVGIRNWIATLPQFGLNPVYRPFINKDNKLGIYEISSHDGTVIPVSFSPAMTEQLIRRITTNNLSLNQLITSDSDAFPTDYEGNPLFNGLYLIRTNTTTKTRTLYRTDILNNWELVDVNAILANSILTIENKLYDIAIEITSSRYDFSSVENDPEFDILMETQFLEYTNSENINNPLNNVDRFRQNNPFTWNYYYSPILNHPLSGTISYDTAGTWQALYQIVFGTAYPHLEPWKLQQYTNKPDWWDNVYLDNTGTRRWLPIMWNNIFNGIIPVGKLAPNGNVGTGNPMQINAVYDYLPVNTGNSSTADGYNPDEIIPPYWNTVNTNNPRIRGLYDPNSGEFVTTPQLNFEFGQNGLVEWQWKTSKAYIYDKLIVSYKIDPMKFIHFTFGIDYQTVSCLQISKETNKVFSHNDIIFHGDFLDDKNNIYRAYGLNQWYVHYNRYSGFDGVSSEFRSLWKDWKTNLSYLVGAFLDTPSFSIESDFFDITTKDYDILVKKTKGIDDKWLNSLTATVQSVPSPYAKLRDRGIGWTVEISNNCPVARPIEYHPVQNYSVNINTSGQAFRLYSYPLASIDYTNSHGYQILEYSTPVALSNSTGLNSAAIYSFEVIFDNVNTIQLSINGTDAQTYSELFKIIDDSISNNGSIVIENGNIVINSSSNSITSAVLITDNDIFAQTNGFVQALPSTNTANKFNKIFKISGNFYNTFVNTPTISITNSTIFDGTFTVDHVYYDVNKLETLIFVKEDVPLPTTGNVIINGLLEPSDAKTLPDDWEDGTEIYFNTTGYLPSNIDDEIPYYLIRLNDREFKIAETKEAALKGISVIPSGSSMGEVFVGKILMTFNALGGALTDYNWRHHAVDYRYVDSSGSNLNISGIQQMVDFLTGYDAYTQTQGFRYHNINGENYDLSTGMNNNWQTVTEKFINWLYALRNFQQETMLKYNVSANASLDTFSMTNGKVPNWNNGTAVLLIPNEGSTLPLEFNSPLSAYIPYYVIKLSDNDTQFKLAATSYDANKGNFIPLSDNGIGDFTVQVYKAITQYPTYELNPFKHYVWINHPQGVLSNVLDDDYTDPTSAARLYDNNLLELTTANVLVFREDKESRIALTEDTIEQNRISETNNKNTNHMSGMHLFFDGYEHIVKFQDYAVDNSLIYDSFLGLNTPQFYTEFDRQQEFTLRPNVGGFYLLGDTLVQNFESTVNDMRYYYDSVKASEGRVTTDLVRKSLGYDGPKDYMSNLKINPKTQFQFWQSMIQNKGTNRAVKAFINQDTFEDAAVDEFWAYKISEFGDNKEKNYIEMKLFPTDVVKNDLRIEFIAPENTALDLSFQGIELTNMHRWWDQPDQIEAMRPYESFFFNSKVIKVVDNVASLVQRIDNKIIYVLDTFADTVVMTYFDPISKANKILNEELDYKFLNAKVIEFLIEPAELPVITMSILSYDYDAQNPAKVIDKDAGSVITTLPIWNPAIGHYYNVPYYAVDLHRPTDPAIYTNSLDGGNTGNATWKDNHINTVWMDSSIEQYVPYFDKTVFPNINDRINKWGKLAEWADINLYQWTKSLIAPEDYDTISQKQSFDATISNEEKVTGIIYKLLYENVNFDNTDELNPEPFWVQLKDVHYDFIAGLSAQGMDQTLAGKRVEVYINGKFLENIEFEDSNSVRVYFNQFNFGDYCHTIYRAPVPTKDELINGKYAYYTPHTIEKKFDVKSGQTYNQYYYWVRDKKQSISTLNSSVSLYSAKKQLVDMSDPYMLLQGTRTPDFGYGLIFGHVFDEFQYNLPYRYTQFIAKGLHGTVKDNNRYVIRFTRDFTLRDKLNVDNITPKNKHEEWKLFRENQLEKIDRYLWNKVTEALIGFKLSTNGNITTQAIPSLNRILFDRLYQTDTQYGLGDEQVFTNKDLSRDTILAVLSNPNQEFEYINIEEFLDNHDFLTPEDIISAMNEIYNNFSIKEVNMIFFAVLNDAMSLKMEHKEIFKTSWVALQISQNVNPTIPVPYDELRLVPGPDCQATPLPPTPTPTVTPLVSVTRTPTPTPTPTPSPTPNVQCGINQNERITEDGQCRDTEEGIQRDTETLIA